MADPREGVTSEGLIVTGARRDRVPPAYEPVLAYVLSRIPPEVPVHVYGSVANGTATVPTSDGTWTTDRLAALTRWSEIEPALAPELVRLRTLCDSGGGSAEEVRTLLGTGGVIELIAARFAAEIGLWQP
ncbi:hypothetical protein [Nocardioides sp. NPDC047086]|uniref:hypothetical protein n=1 Tax=Nocardioides sp. NPDC047086 TaxID=3154810 RepID=UPI0033D5BF50